MVFKSRLILFCFMILCSVAAIAQQPLFWGGLKPGLHSVGFQSRWVADYSRTYQLPGASVEAILASKAPRPILLNIWYPAVGPKGQPLKQRDYFAIETKQPEFKQVAEKLRAYELDTVATEVMRKEPAKLTPEEKAVLNQILDTATAAYRDAKPTPGKFPLVIYHAGNGSSFDDNSVLCEYLASHGYVVVGSAFQSLDGSSMAIEGGEGSGQDIRFIIGYCRTMPNVNWDQIGFVGHSAGAQAGVIFQTHAGTRVDALVSLDTTEDYYSLADTRWRYMTDPVQRNMGIMHQPILFCAGPEAGFDMVDRMKFTPRHIFTIDQLNHNDFISQGTMSHRAKSLLMPDSVELKQTAQTILDRYVMLNEVELAFLTKCLKGDSKLLDQLMTRYDAPVRMDSASLSYAPVGQVGPAPYDSSRSLPPGPRDIRPLIAKNGAVETGKLLQRYKDQIKVAPIYDTQFAFALVFQLASDSKDADAKTMFAAYRDAGVDAAKALLSNGSFAKRFGMLEFAEKCFRILLMVDPGNKEAADELKAMGKGEES
ncbi:MAG: hypothetical protein KF784_00730 [Fimbriimonadaceae bacterium]|nr:hypothetical protein [Fimbriimonadaceae bacterium]